MITPMSMPACPCSGRLSGCPRIRVFMSVCPYSCFHVRPYVLFLHVHVLPRAWSCACARAWDSCRVPVSVCPYARICVSKSVSMSHFLMSVSAASVSSSGVDTAKCKHMTKASILGVNFRYFGGYFKQSSPIENLSFLILANRKT